MASDGLDFGAIDALMKDPAPQGGGLDFGAIDTLAAPQRADGRPTGAAQNAFARGAVDAIPIVGGMALSGINKGDAFIRAMQNGTSYTEELAKAEDYGKRTDEAHPYAKTAGEVAGGVAATVPLAAAAPAAFGISKAPLLARTAASLATNAGIGGADAGVRSGGDLAAIDRGAALGGALGAAGPAIGRGVGAAIEHGVGAIASRGVRVPGAGNATADSLTKMVKQSGGPEAVDARLQQLGPDAMLLDASPTFTGKAQGLAVEPETRQMVTDPLVARNRGTNDRLAQSLDAELGPVVEPSVAGQSIDRIRQTGGRLYQGIWDSHRAPVDTSAALTEIGDQLRTAVGPERNALLAVRNQLMEPVPEHLGGPNAVRPVTDAQTIHNVKHGIYQTIEHGDPTLGIERGRLTQTDGALSQVSRALNGALEEQVPDYARANLAYRTAMGAHEALDNAGKVLGPGGPRPYDHFLAINEMPMEQQAANRIGLRAKVDDVVGGRRNDLVALSQQWKEPADHDYQKLAQTFGREPVENVANALEREGTFRQNYADVLKNSQTAQRSAGHADVKPRELSTEGAGSLALTGGIAGLPGAAVDATLRAGRLGITAAQRASDIARNRETAQILTMTAGPERDALMAALTARIAASHRGEIPANNMDRFVAKMLQSRGYQPGLSDQRDAAPQ